jgi:hypothetical protein
MFVTKEKFNEQLKIVLVNNKDGYIMAVLQTCDKLGIDPSTVNKYISRPIKEKIRIEGEKNHMLPRSPSLPI